MRYQSLVVLFVLVFCACAPKEEAGTKYFTNLRHTKNAALFICNAPKGAPNTFRAIKADKDNPDSAWTILTYVDNDIKRLANSYCKDKFNLPVE